jgi:hypothetical protein
MPVILSVATMVWIAVGVSAQTKPNFAGEWKIDDSAAAGGAGRSGTPGPDLTITQSATAMSVEYMKAPATAKLSYKLDGSVSKNMVAGRRGGAPIEQVSKAVWTGNRLVVTTTTGAGEEKRTFSLDGDYLVVETSAPSRNGGAPNVTKVTYKEYIRGFGG